MNHVTHSSHSKELAYMPSKKIFLILLIVCAVFGFYHFGLDQYLSLEYFSAQRDTLLSYQQQNPIQTAAIFFAIYVAVTAFSLPAAALITLAGGAIFGLVWGTILVSFASTIGATLAFIMARTLFRDAVQAKFKTSFEKINAGVESDGAFYLFGLRLVPIFPFVAVNLLMGLSNIKVSRYFWVSQVGMLPGTIVYVNAGTQLAEIDSLAGIASPAILLSFAALGVFPLIAKRLLDRLKALRVYQGFDKPKKFDSNLVVIGAGAAGLVSAYIAAATKAKVDLIEKHKMGGDCLNTGCVPSKALIRSAKIKHYVDHSAQYGIETSHSSVNFERVMTRIQEVITKIEPHDSVERYTGLGVNCIEGAANILDPWRVQVGSRTITAKNIIIATGARPAMPDIPGLRSELAFNSDTIWSLRKAPKSMIVVGEGPIGCELAQSFHRIGVPVSLVGRNQTVLPREDKDMGELVQQRMAAEGMNLFMGYTAVEVKSDPNEPAQQILCASNGADTIELPFDCILFAVGRHANTSGFGLEELGIDIRENGTLDVNEYLQTKYPNIYACGDVAGPYQLTHAAAHQAWYASVNALFGSLKRFKADYRVIPWATFTDPEIARVGLSETEAQAQDIEYDVHSYGIDDLDRAIADSVDYGKVKVLTAKDSDKVLGACIVGHHAGDLITEFVTGMKHGLGLNKLLGTIHIYPTLAESNKYLAGEWKRASVNPRTLDLLKKFHRWQR